MLSCFNVKGKKKPEDENIDLTNRTWPKRFGVHESRKAKFILPKRYVNVETVGLGAEAYVAYAFDVIHKRNVAIKQMKHPFKNEWTAKNAYREFKILTKLNHKNTIKLLDAFTSEPHYEGFTHLYLVTEMMCTDLNIVTTKRLGHEKISLLVYQMLCAVKYLNNCGIVHRDIKPGNVLINYDGSLKLCDFGLARINHPKLRLDEPAGSLFYCAPEILLNKKYDWKVDIWSIGCVMTELILCNVLFYALDLSGQWEEIIKRMGTPDADFLSGLDSKTEKMVMSKPFYKPTKIMDYIFQDTRFRNEKNILLDETALKTEQAKDLLSRMLVIDPKNRISVEEALKHDYVRHWYKEEDLNHPTFVPYNYLIEEQDFTIREWKDLLFRELCYYEDSLVD